MKVPDIVAPDLRVLFCGINPGLYSAAVGHNFARPRNRFWPALFASGFTDRLLAPSEETQLFLYGCGITNIVERATAGAAELSPAELRRGAKKLTRIVLRFKPVCLGMVGISAYRIAFDRPKAKFGLQEKHLIGSTRVWALPNPSGLNAHFQLPQITEEFRKLKAYLDSKLK